MSDLLMEKATVTLTMAQLKALRAHLDVTDEGWDTALADVLQPRPLLRQRLSEAGSADDNDEAAHRDDDTRSVVSRVVQDVPHDSNGEATVSLVALVVLKLANTPASYAGRVRSGTPTAPRILAKSASNSKCSVQTVRQRRLQAARMGLPSRKPAMTAIMTSTS